MTAELLFLILLAVVLVVLIVYHVMYARAAQLGFDWIRTAGSYEAAMRIKAGYDAQLEAQLARGIRSVGRAHD